MEFQNINTYEKKLCPLYKHYFKLVLFGMLSSIIKFCKIISFLYDLDIERVKSNNRILVKLKLQ